MRCKIVKAQKVMCQNNKKSIKNKKKFDFTLQYRHEDLKNVILYGRVT